MHTETLIRYLRNNAPEGAGLHGMINIRIHTSLRHH